MLRKACFVCISASIALCSSLSAQTGLYSNGTFDSRGFDSVNLGNLNTHFEIPIINKPGRGLPFTYSLVYEGLIWSAVNSNGATYWEPDPSWGFNGSGSLTGTLSWFTFTSSCSNGDLSYTQTDYTYRDAKGIAHLFNYSLSVDCSENVTSSGSGASFDGSGLTYVPSDQHVQAQNGTSIYPTVLGNAAPGVTPCVTDQNGNYIACNSDGSYTDTLGVKELVVNGGGSASSPVTFTYPVVNQPNGATTATATLYYKTYTVQTQFGCNGVAEYGPTSVDLVDHITLADSAQDTYSFTYEPTASGAASVTGRLASVTLPTGGTINYAYLAGCGAGINPDGSVGALQRSTTDGSRLYGRGPNGSGTITVVQDEKNNQTEYWFSPAANTGLVYETHRRVFQGNTSGPMLLDRYTCYNGAAPSCDGQALTTPFTQTEVVTSYNGGVQDYNTSLYNSTGTLLTQTTQASSSAVLATATYSYNGLGEVLKASTYDGPVSSYPATQLTNAYDETIPTPTTNIPQHNAEYGTVGNLTTSTMSTGSAAPVQTVTAYYDTGQPVSTQDGGGFVTQYSYDPTQGFVTQTAYPTPSSDVSLSTSATFDSQSGALLTSTGMNANQTTIVNTYDPLLRPITITPPTGGGQITYSYDSPTSSSVTQVLNAAAGTYSKSQTQLDAYGRTSRVQVYNGQASNPWYQSDYCYDAAGLLAFVSTPYQSTGTSAAKRCNGSGKSYVYDALGRVTTITTDDGPATMKYNGRAVLRTDVNGVKRITQYDLLGRISGVCEISGSSLAGQSPASCGMDIAGTGYLTSYTYSLLNHTVQISQGNQQRVFQTDSAGRTVYTYEPERGNTTYAYSYNSVGLQVMRTRLRANGSSGFTHTTSQYDALGRLVSTSYDDGLTPNKTYFYDTLPANSGWSGAGGNIRGLLAATASGSGSTATGSSYSYDLMGNVTTILQCGPSICGTQSQSSRSSLFAYDGGGNLAGELDPTSGAIGYARSPAGELTTMTNYTYQDSGNPATLVSQVANGPFGPTSYLLGNGLNAAKTYDTVGRNNGNWVCSGTASAYCTNGAQLYGDFVTWSGSRSTSMCDTVVSQCQVHNYDEFNRLAGVYGANQSYSYTYDQYGNRTNQTPQNGTTGPPPSFSFNNLNQIVGLPYDAAGNLESDGTSHSYTYDAEGNVVSVDNGNTATYVYDALNHRVASTTPAGSYEFLYDASGQRTSTWLVSQNVGIEGRIYWDGKLIAHRAPNGQTYFQHQDWLGTERLRTNMQAQTATTENSLSFGDNRQETISDSGATIDNNQFTSQELDTDGTTHFQFRQYSAAQGRWMSPDPYSGSYSLWNPQSLNRYTYVENSPLSLVDPLGLDDFGVGDCIVDVQDYYVNDEYQGSDVFWGACDTGGGSVGGGGGGGSAPNSPSKMTPAQCAAAKAILAREAQYGTTTAARMSGNTFGDNTLTPFNSTSVPNLMTSAGQLDLDWFTDLRSFSTAANWIMPINGPVSLHVYGKLSWTAIRLQAGLPIGHALPFTDPGERLALAAATSGMHYSDIFTPSYMAYACK